MRLLKRDEVGNYSLTPDLSSDDVPPYGILSHTWGLDEILFADLAKPPADWQVKAGYRKIEFCADRARQHGLHFFWVDTCCIDKSNSVELQTAINSMFRWYRNAKRCYVYLSDVSGPSASSGRKSLTNWHDAFRQSRWFTRGWTLQELIAPKTVDFYSQEGVWLGDKQSLEPIIRDITGVPASALRGATLSEFPVSERQAWVRSRQTKFEEDMAYSLLGIFEVQMPLIYGEGRESAQRRLREEVQKNLKGVATNNFSVTFSLSEVPEIEHFIAREKEIAEVHRTLASDGTRRVVVLHGLGGIGKTQLAVAYIKRYRDEHSAIFWFNIKDELSIRQSFIKVARQILQQYPDATGLSAHDLQDNHSEAIEAVKAWLSLPGNTRWLTVFDNYDDPKLTGRTDGTGIDISRFLPTAYQGSVIITSRLSQVNIGHPIRIRKLESMEASLEILSSTSGRKGLFVDEDAKKLVEKLDGLPLALATAGAYLRRVSMSLADYLRHYENSWARLHTSTPSLGSYEDRTLCSTWQISYEQVQEQNPLAAHLLRWWAYFDNEDIWFELINSHNAEHPAWRHDLADELNFNAAMGTLHDYGFVEPHTLNEDLIESRGYSIHGCLHSWTTHMLNQGRDAELAKFAVQCVASRVPSREHAQFWLLQRRLLSHAVVTCAAIEGNDEDLASAFACLGVLYADQGKLQEAEEMFLLALQGFEKAWGADHVSTLNTVKNLGVLYADQGKLQAAEEMYLRALQGFEKAWGADHVLTLDTVKNLGVLYAGQGKLQEAEEMFLLALQEFEKARRADHVLALETVNNLGVFYMKQHKLQAAEEMYLRAILGFEKAWGPDHTSTLNAVNNLGILYRIQNNPQAAEEMLIRALRGKEKTYGPDHTSTLDTVQNLGILYRIQNNPQAAEEMLIRALRGKEKTYGPVHPSILLTVSSLGNLYLNQGNLQEGKEMYLRAIQGYEEVIGPQDVTRYRPAIYAMVGLGCLLRRQGNLVEARRYHQRAYNDLRGLIGLSTEDVQSLQNALLELQNALLELDPTIDADSGAGETSAPMTTTTPPKPTQAKKSRRREVFQRLLGIRSK